MSQTTLEHDAAPEAGESGGSGLARSLVRVVILSVIVTILVAGVYLLFNGRGSSDPLAAQGTGATGATGAGAKGGAAAGAKGGNAAKAAAAEEPPTYAELAAKAADKILADVDAGERRAALVKYLKKVDIKITSASSPATAATTACDFLADGTSPKKLRDEVARGGGFTKEQSEAFLLGAATLYCPKYAKDFR